MSSGPQKNKKTKIKNIIIGNYLCNHSGFLLGCFFVAFLITFFIYPYSIDASQSPNPCVATSNCSVEVTSSASDPEGDPINVTFTATTAAGSYAIAGCSLGGQYVDVGYSPTCTTPYVTGSTLTATVDYVFTDSGTHTANYTFCDDAGHCSSGSESVYVTIDTTPPATPTLTVTAHTTTSITWTSSVGSDSGGAGLAASPYGFSSSSSGPFTYQSSRDLAVTGLSCNTSYTRYVVVKDAVGNVSAVSAGNTYSTDACQPPRSASLSGTPSSSGAISSPSQFTYTPTCVAQQGTTLSSCVTQASTDGGSNWNNISTSQTSNQTSSFSSGTNYVFRTIETDSGGTVTSTKVPASGNICFDNTLPTVSSGLTATPSGWTSSSVSITGTISDTNSCGISGYFYKCRAADSYSYGSGSNISFPCSYEGTNIASVQPVDTAGNTGSVSSVTYYIDLTAPTPNPPTLSGVANSCSSITWTLSTGSDSLSGLNSSAYGFATSSGGTYSYQVSRSWTENSLSPSTAYTRYGKIRDAAGNITSYGSASVTTPSCQVRSASLSGSPSSASIISSPTQFTYTPSCLEEGGTTLSSCATQISTNNGSNWSQISTSQSSNQTYSFVSGNYYRFRTVETDSGGSITSASVPSSGDICFDNVNPSTSGLIASPSGWTNGIVTISGTVTDSGNCGISGYFYKCRAADSYSYASGSGIGFPCGYEGTNIASVQPVDAAGNTGSVSSVTYYIDQTAPTPNPPTLSSTVNNCNSITWTLSTGSDSLSGLNSSAYGFATSSGGTYSYQVSRSWTETVSENSSYTRYGKIRDVLGNTTSYGSASATTPVCPPGTLTFSSKPSNPSNSSTATFIWGAVSGATSYLTQIDSGTPQSQTQLSIQYSGLSNSNHTVTVCPVNSGGQGTCDSWTWLVDTINPTSVNLSISPSCTTGSFGLSWTAATDSGSGLNHYELWRAPDSSGTPGTWSKIGSDISSGTLSATDSPTEGKWWYGLHAVDGASNYSTEVSAQTGTRDNTVPTPNPPTLTGVANSSSSITWTLSSGSDSGCGLNSSAYGFATTSGGTYNYQAGVSWTENSLSPSTSYTRYGKIRDAAGNITSYGSATVTTLDVTARSATLSGSPSASGAFSSPIQFTYSPTCSAQGGTTLSSCSTQVSTNSGGNWSQISTSQTSNQTYSFSSGTNYRFRTVETDTGGSITSTNIPTSGDMCFDNAAPSQVTVTVTPSSTSGAFTISWTAATDAGVCGLNHYELWRAPDSSGTPGTWSKIGSDISIGTLSTTNTPSTDGRWWYGVHTIDNAGNYSSEVAAQSGIKDTTAPTPNPPTITASNVTTNSVTWTISSGSDSGAGLASSPYGFAVTSGGTYSYQSGVSWTENSLSCGTNYTRYGKIKDLVGNLTSYGSGSATTSVCPPGTLSFSSKPTNPVSSTTATFSWNSVTDATSYLIQLDTDTPTSQTQLSKQYTGLSNASHTVTACPVNDSGQGTCDSWTWTVDTINPTSVNVAVTPSSTVSSFTVSWTAATDSGSGLNHYELWRAPDSSGTPGTWSKIGSDISSGTLSTTDSPTEGKWWYGIHAVDNATNYSTENSAQSGIKDTTAPTPNPPTITASNPTQTSITWTISSGSDSGVGLNSTPYGFANSATGTYNYQTSTSWTETGLACNSSFTRYGKIRDAVGNLTSYGQVTASTSTTCAVRTADLSGSPLTAGWINSPSLFTYTPACYPAVSTTLVSCITEASTNSGGSWTQISNTQASNQTYNFSLGNCYRFHTIETDTGGTVTSTSVPSTNDICFDNTNPSSVTLTVTPTSTNTSFNISWTAATDSGSGLNHYELWRAPDSGGTPGTWSKIGSDISSGTLSTTDTPAVGIWWYGLHAVDGAGNYSTENSAETGIKDTTSPTCGTWSPATSPWHDSGGQLFTLSGSTDTGGSGINIDGGSCTTASTNGATCTVQILDNANNQTTCTSPVNNLDSTAPSQMTLTVTPTYSITTFNISWTAATDAESGLSHYELWRAIDNAGSPSTWQKIGSDIAAGTTSTTDTPAVGIWWYGIHAVNNAGGYSTEVESKQVYKDNISPLAGSCSPGSGVYTDTQSVTCVAGADQGSPQTITALHYTIGSSPVDPSCGDTVYSSSIQVSNSNNPNILKIVTCDQAGNPSTVTTYTYNFDSGQPTIVFSPTSRTWATDNISVNVTASDPNGVEYVRHCWAVGASCDPGSVNESTFTNGGAITQSADGDWQLCVRAKDAVGNWNSSPICSAGTYQKDTAGPILSNWSPVKGGSTNALRPTISFNVTEPSGSSSTSIIVTRSGTIIWQKGSLTGSSISEIIQDDSDSNNLHKPLSNGLYNIQIIAVDGLGNLTNDVTWSFTVNNQKPGKPIVN